MNPMSTEAFVSRAKAPLAKRSGKGDGDENDTDTTTIAIKNKLFNALVKPVLLYACEIWGPELLSYKTYCDKSTIEQVHIKVLLACQ